MKMLSLKRINNRLFLSGLIFWPFILLSGQTEPSNPLPQFLFPAFSKSLVKMKAGNEYTAEFNYNIVDEEMVFSRNNQYMVPEKPGDIDTIIIENRRFVPVEKAFYEVLVKGSATMYIQHKGKYTSVGTATAYGLTSQTNANIVINTVSAGTQFRTLDVPDNVTVSKAPVNWIKINNVMNKFTSERQFLKIFPGKENELKEYIKKSDINIDSREDLIKLGKYCNEIVK
jgi:hypothetical protein